MNTTRLMHTHFASSAAVTVTFARGASLARRASALVTTVPWRGVVAMVDHPSAAPPA
jgi:hypothetical protein